MRLRLFTILLLILSAAITSGKDDDVPQEYLVKARYLLNIPLFTEVSAKAKIGQSYTICLIGDTPLESILASSSGKLIKNHPLAVLKVTDLQASAGLAIFPDALHRLIRAPPSADAVAGGQ